MKKITKTISKLGLSVFLTLSLSFNSFAEDDDLMDILSDDITTGEAGSFGTRLNELGVIPFIHGYTVFDINALAGAPLSFDAHYFNIFVGANIKDLINVEMQIEKEHGGDEQQVRFAQFDIKANPLAIFRAGKFLAPIGAFNEYLYPEYIYKLPNRPFAMREIIPVSWPEVGVQLRGKYDYGIDQNINYAFFVSNGLEQKDSNSDDDIIDDAGSIRSMRNNHRDQNNSDKAFGGRLGFRPTRNLDLGLSAYTGAYTVDGKQRLSLVDFDFSYTLNKLYLSGEYVFAHQGAEKTAEIKQGFYFLSSYKTFDDYIEPVFQYDMISYNQETKNNRQRLTFGLNYYPFPIEYDKLMVKSSYAYTIQKDNTAPHEIEIQTAIGF